MNHHHLKPMTSSSFCNATQILPNTHPISVQYLPRSCHFELTETKKIHAEPCPYGWDSVQPSLIKTDRLDEPELL